MTKQQITILKKCFQVLARSQGFTLMEVLVATAIVGIGLGVALSAISQGHRQAFRGDMARQAAIIGEQILRGLSAQSLSMSQEEGEVEGYPGWHYRLEVTDTTIMVSAKGIEPVEIEEHGLRELILHIKPPGSSREFTMRSLILEGKS